jgi:hypothetical protein
MHIARHEFPEKPLENPMRKGPLFAVPFTISDRRKLGTLLREDRARPERAAEGEEPGASPKKGAARWLKMEFICHGRSSRFPDGHDRTTVSAR